MRQDKREQDFDDYLEGDSNLSANYRQASTEQAPAHIDDAILAASRKAVKSAPGKVATPFSLAWYLPLSIAAVLVLSVSVVVTMQYENDEIYLKEPARYPAKITDEIGLKNEPAAFEELDLSQMKDRANIAEKEPALRFDNSLGAMAEIPAKSDVLDENKESLEKAAKKRKQQKHNSLKIRRREVFLDMQAPIAQEEQSYAPDPASIVKTLEREQSFEVDDSARQLTSSPIRMKESRVEFDTMSSAVPEVEKAGGIKAKSALSMKPAAEQALLSQSAGMSVHTSSPEAWLDLIEQLWRDGNRAEAILELEKFHLKFSDFEEEIKQYLDSELVEAVIDK